MNDVIETDIGAALSEARRIALSVEETQLVFFDDQQRAVLLTFVLDESELQ